MSESIATSVQLLEDSETNILSTNLLHLVKLNKISEGELAKQLGLPYNTIHRLITGETIDPRISTLNAICEHFNISLDHLTNNLITEKKSFTKLIQVKNVPIMAWEFFKHKDFPTKIDLQNHNMWEVIAMNQFQQFSAHTFALKSRRNTQPRFPANALLLIDPEETPRDGDIVVVRVINTNEITIRELIIDPPHHYLNSITSTNNIIFTEAEYRIIGVNVLTKIHNRSE